MTAPGPRRRLAHPFWQALALLVAAYLFFKIGLGYLPPLIGIKSAPIPNTVLLQYMAIAFVGILIYVSDSEERWSLFRQPIHAGMVDPDKKLVRGSLLVLLPLLVGFVTWRSVRPSIEGPAQLRSIHPANPSTITVHGNTLDMATLTNPLRTQGDTLQHLANGRRVYYQNCVFCHGDRFDGQGHFAHAFNPAPLSFADNGTIAQLSEGYVFWRIAKGGRGLPSEGTPWNSAMPAWEDFLTDEEMWAVTMYIYNHTGWKPRVMHEEAAGAAH